MDPLKYLQFFFLFRAGVGIAEKIANFPVCDTNGKGWLMLVYWEKAQICEIITDYSNVCKMGSQKAD